MALCLGNCGGRAHRSRLSALLRFSGWLSGVRVPVRACLSILELCERFRDSSQASGASQRVQWACAPRPLGCGADGPAQHGPSRGRSLDFAWLGRCAPAWLLGLTPLPVRCVVGPALHDLSVLRAARGQRVLCGTEWTLCAPTGGVALFVARGLRFWRRARLLSREGGRACDPNPHLTLRTHVLQPARFGARRACVDGFPSLRACFASVRRSVGGAAGRACSGAPPGVVYRCARGSAGYLVDPASSHMLVSKIKPCMSKYKRLVL